MNLIVKNIAATKSLIVARTEDPVNSQDLRILNIHHEYAIALRGIYRVFLKSDGTAKLTK